MTDALRTWTRGRTRIVLASWAWLAAATWFTSDALLPAGPFGPCAMIVIGLVIGVSWAWASLLWLGSPYTRRGLLIWFTVPAAPVVAYTEARTAWPMAVRVWLCESELRGHTDRRRIDPFEHVTDRRPEPQCVGLFVVEEISRLDHGAVMFTTGRWCFAPSGLVYIPEDVPDELHYKPSPLTHLYGPWYRCAVRD